MCVKLFYFLPNVFHWQKQIYDVITVFIWSFFSIMSIIRNREVNPLTPKFVPKSVSLFVNATIMVCTTFVHSKTWILKMKYPIHKRILPCYSVVSVHFWALSESITTLKCDDRWKGRGLNFLPDKRNRQSYIVWYRFNTMLHTLFVCVECKFWYHTTLSIKFLKHLYVSAYTVWDKCEYHQVYM